MNEFWKGLQQFLGVLRFWIVISPFERALRIRLGKSMRMLGPGLHWKLPWIDVIYLQNVRRRVSAVGQQTVTTQDGKTITVSCAVGYVIADLELLYNSLHHAEETIRNEVKSAVASYIANHTADECHPAQVKGAVSQGLDMRNYGLAEAELYLTEFAVVKTFRMIGEHYQSSWDTRELDCATAVGEDTNGRRS